MSGPPALTLTMSPCLNFGSFCIGQALIQRWDAAPEIKHVLRPGNPPAIPSWLASGAAAVQHVINCCHELERRRVS